MAWTYSAFEEQTTSAARLEMLRQHISEVRAEIQPNVTLESAQRTNDVLARYLEGLNERRQELEALSGAADDDQRITSSFIRGEPVTRETL
jgi:hypothetical protein